MEPTVRKGMTPPPRSYEPTRTGLGPESIGRAFLDNLFYIQARFAEVASPHDYYLALAYTVRDRLLDRWVRTAQAYKDRAARTVCYLSAEYLLGPHLGNNILNMGIDDAVREAVAGLGLDLEELIEEEEEPGLGNGGLGRLAACFMESMATLRIPAIGYGIRYEFGIFDQAIRDGRQVETTDKWLRRGNPWEIPRPGLVLEVKLGGRTEHTVDPDGRFRVRWIPDRVVRGMAFDTPILGHRVTNANLLRLWSAGPTESFDFQAFNMGDYWRAVEEKVVSENLTKVLYPNDEPEAGRQLRLQQQYFFVSCSLQDMIRIHLQAKGKGLDSLHEKYVVQLNDTHPAIAVAELMRLLVDEHDVGWDTAWEITRRTFAYTNHTLLPEALEKWPVDLFRRVLPRHMEIVHEINHRFLDDVRRAHPGDDERLRRMSLIDEGGERYVRMAHLACVGSSAINGVARMHTDLLQQTVLRDFHEMWPEKFSNKTNGVTPRRFLMLANSRLRDLLTRTLGPAWTTDLDRLRALEPLAEDPEFRREWRAVKRAAKADLADRIRADAGVAVDPDSMFDVQAKRIHEYKRQHLNLLHVVALYHRLRRDPGLDAAPRTAIFGGKAAPGYFMAKLIIKAVHSIAEVVNADPAVRGRLAVAFSPDFNVKNAQWIYPAADLSEQISTAGKEASGTGNMKFAMNGALTIGTLDGANVEIRDAVGPENFFLFGLTVDEVQALKTRGYDPREYVAGNAELREALDTIASGFFSRGDAGLFRPLVDSLLHGDEYMLLADYASYVECQDRAGRAYRDAEGWTRMSILNVARIGTFSSDRAIREYCEEIWKVGPVPVELPEPSGSFSMAPPVPRRPE
ncbi:MAG: glycogen/starch/alpha-glucan phosphorylase [Myxococcota bacterium]|nr:glycogen/starch/alpha-glucan phosphorylase [Myxococcota bacterium]